MFCPSRLNLKIRAVDSFHHHGLAEHCLHSGHIIFGNRLRSYAKAQIREKTYFRGMGN